MDYQELKKRVQRVIPSYLSGAFDVVFAGDEGDFWDVLDVVTHALSVDPDETWGRFNKLLGVEESDVSSTFRPVPGGRN